MSSLQFFDFQDTSVYAKRARRKAFRTKMIRRAFPATVENTENVSVTINNSSPLTFMIDSGATYTILPTTTAQSISFDQSNPIRQQGVTTVSGQQQANVFNVSMKINDTPAFQTEILVMDSAFNLLSTEDLAKAYTATLAPGGVGFHLVPLGQSQTSTPPAPATPPPPAPTVPQQPAPAQPPLNINQLPASIGQAIRDILRQIHQILCGGAAKFPFVCNNNQTFMMSMLFIGLMVIVLMVKGITG